jgi:phosphoribosyl 1,2-cyclic phosphodiesterase/CheY-like chemotaxis protein
MKILLIDDDEVCRSPAAEMFRRKEWEVLVASDGESGIALAVEHLPDIILCDLLMARGNGFQVCRAVRERLDMRHSKIIVWTGRDFPADRKSALDSGADLYLIKPIEFSALEEAIKSVLPPVRNHVAPPVVAAQKTVPTTVKFWGVRGSIPTPGPSTVHFGGNTACVEVRSQGEIVILDAGSGIRPLGQSLAKEFENRPMNLTVLITHTHWDHIQGFPFFLPAYDSKNKLHVLGFEGACDGLRTTLAGQMESPYFPIALHQMPGNIVIEELKEKRFKVGPIPAEACFTNHPGVCVGYRLATPEGTIVYMPDNETFSKNGKPSNGRELPSTLESNLLDFVRDCDILICDTQYDSTEYASHIGWGHGCVDEVVRFAVAANAKRLFLFHHDPSHDDRFMEGMLAHAQRVALALGSSLKVDAAREGECFELPLVARAS